MSDILNPMPATATDSPSYVAPDATQPYVPGTTVRGADRSYPELAQSHPDNVALRIADLSDETSTGHDSSDPSVIEDRAPAGHWSSDSLHSGVDAEK